MIREEKKDVRQSFLKTDVGLAAKPYPSVPEAECSLVQSFNLNLFCNSS